MPMQITMTGNAVASIETARPWITLVPWPVVEDSATLRTGRYSVEVKYSVIQTMRPVTARPTIAAINSRMPVTESPLVSAQRIKPDKPVDDQRDRNHRQEAGRDEPLIERPHNAVVGAEPDKEGADNRGHDATAPIAKGSRSSRSSKGGAKKIAASSIVATIVTT